jgi:hypothetical protein
MGLVGQIIQMTPILLTVLATALAGMSSSEMTQSMYYRSLAGQHQSKAGDQWAFFQAKRIRGTSLEGTVTLLKSVAQLESPTATQMRGALGQIIAEIGAASLGGKKAAGELQSRLDQWQGANQKNPALAYLFGPALPSSADQELPKDAEHEDLHLAVAAMGRRHSEAELAELVKKVDPAQIEAAALVAEHNADLFDQACEPASAALAQLRGLIAAAAAAAGDADAKLRAELHQLSTQIELISSDFDARRYRRESVYNRKAAELYELRVARSGVTSDKHRDRSRNFFFSMLLAQAGVTISSLALARTNKSLFWSLAALAGLASVLVTGWTYLAAN